jgi:Zn-dependent protease with chaperone function
MKRARMGAVLEEGGRRPARWGLAALAVGATVLFQLVQLLPWVFFLGLGALWFNRPWMLWLAGGTAVFMAWLLQPGLRLGGDVLQRTQAPRLFTLVEELQMQLDAPAIDEIRLEQGEFNAAALELGANLFRWRTRRILFLGVPLLAILDTPALRAVIAHELGHFSRRHGRLGHWVYRARLGWLSLAGQADQYDSPFDRAMASFAQWFGPWFARRSFAYSQACEYEADAEAAGTGAADMARALVHVAVAGARLDALHVAVPYQHMLKEPQAPADWTRVEQAAALGAPITDDVIAAVLDAQAIAPGDTHPATRLRCKALGGVPAARELGGLGPAAGGELLGAHWDTVARQRDERWHAEHRSAWAVGHAVRRSLRARHEELALQGAPTIERLRLEDLLHGPAATEALATGSAHAQSLSAEGEYLLGRARLMLGDAGGVAQLRACIKLDPAWAAAARTVLAGPGARFLSAEEARQNTVLLQRARQRHALAAEAVMQQWAAGTLAAAALTPSQAAALHAGVAAQPGVREAWCFGGQASVGEQRYPACVLVVLLDTWAAPGVLADEDGVRAQLQALLGGVVPAHWLLLVHTCLTTEAPDPGLERAIAAAPQARLLPG